MSDRPVQADDLLPRLPLPLAQLYRRAHNAKTPRDAHDFAFYLWEASLKLIGVAAAVSYRPDGPPDPKIAAALENLARPSLGHWCEIVRRLVPVLSERGPAGYKAVNELLYGRPRSDLPRCAGLVAALEFALGKPGGPKPTVQVGDLFDRLVEYRNKTSGHGAPAARTAELLRGLADAFMWAAAELFTRLDVLAGRRLIFVADIRPVRASWLIERVELAGVAPWRVASLEVPRSEGQPPPLETGVCLGDPNVADDPAGLTLMHPLLVYEPDSESVLFLNARRGGRRVELLCYSDGRTVEMPDAGGASADDEPPAPDAPAGMGRRIGEYKLLTELGRGAMGVVYRAWQPSLGREVAIKVQPRTGDAKADARFRREVRALGRVEHPNLIKVHTSGSDGEYFYYTMELVDGAPLAAVTDALTNDGHTTIVDLPALQKKVGAACAAAKAAEKPLTVTDKIDPFRRQVGEKSKELVSLPEMLLGAKEGEGRPPAIGRDSIRRIVALVRQVASAAHALHEAGILHRDIKPGNILVTADATTAVLMDLGLAQLADDIEGRLTRTRQFVGTLRYASPQQVLAGGPLDRRPDLYSLGATLWELLALRPLFGATEAMPTLALMEMIQRDEPERLRRLNRSVDRDLEAVVHKCLEKSPDRRYATAEELADDLGRWLDGKPVRARPVRSWERAWKWSKRRPLLSGLTTALAIAIAVGTVASRVLAVRAQREAANARAERDVAREQKRRTRLALDTMVSPEMVERLGSQKELTKSQREFLQTALGYYKEFAADAPTDEEGRRLEADANFRVGDLLQSLGQNEEAVAAYRRALSNYEVLSAEFPARPEYRHNEATCHNYLGSLHTSLGRSVAAEADLRAALSTLESLAADFPAAPEYRRDLGQCHINLGVLFFELAKYPAAKAEYEAALAVQAKLATDFPGVPDYRSVVATTHNNLGNVLARLNQRTAAEAQYRAAAAIKEKLAAEYPAVPKYRNEAAKTHNNLGALYRLLRRFPAAEAEERAALVIQERLVTDFPAVPSYAVELCGSYLNLGNVLFDKGDATAALVWHAKAIDRGGPVVAAEPRLATARQFLRNAHEGRAGDLAQLKRYADAVPDWDSALKLDDGTHRFAIRTGRAECLARLGRAAEAVREASELAADPAANEDSIYNCACFASLASAVPNNSAANAQAARAVELLRRTIAKGYTDIPYLLADADLAPLRRRADYADLLWDIADMPAAAPAGR